MDCDMNESKNLIGIEDVLTLFKKHGVKKCRYLEDDYTLDVEFFDERKPDTDVDAISKVLTDSMPPDSAMLFAATEEPVQDNE